MKEIIRMNRGLLLGAVAAAVAAALLMPSAATAQNTKRASFKTAVTLKGFNGERVRVRPYRMLSNMPPSEFEDRDPRYRYVGLLVSITNVGRRTVRDSPTNGAVVVTRAGRAIGATIIIDDDVCDSFGGSVTIPRGQTRRGCVGFKVPAGARLRFFEFTWNSGFADQTGQWSLAGIQGTAR